MVYQVISANLLSATEEYICQQTCCTALRPHGLSEVLRIAFGACPYSERRRFKGNWAILEDRPRPGTVTVYVTESKTKIACLFAQYTHGKPGAYKDPLETGILDSHADRVVYFRQCLTELSKLNPTSVAFPYKIGCGLAGGDWSVYEKILQEWSSENPSILIKIYKL